MNQPQISTQWSRSSHHLGRDQPDTHDDRNVEIKPPSLSISNKQSRNTEWSRSCHHRCHVQSNKHDNREVEIKPLSLSTKRHKRRSGRTQLTISVKISPTSMITEASRSSRHRCRYKSNIHKTRSGRDQVPTSMITEKPRSSRHRCRYQAHIKHGVVKIKSPPLSILTQQA